MKVIIAGGRNFDNQVRLNWECGNLLRDETDVEVVCGMADGADLLGWAFADNHNYTIKEFPAAWTTHGKSAGHIRNQEMADYADTLIAFWDGKSNGTKSMITKALSAGLEVHVYRYAI